MQINTTHIFGADKYAFITYNSTQLGYIYIVYILIYVYTYIYIGLLSLTFCLSVRQSLESFVDGGI